MQNKSQHVICALCLLISVASGCTSVARPAAPPQWPAIWSGRQIFNAHGNVVYARDGSVADGMDQILANVGKDFTRRTGRQPPGGLLIVNDLEDSKLGDLEPQELVRPNRQQKDLSEMGFTPQEIALSQPLEIENSRLTKEMGFPVVAVNTISWAMAIPSDRRIAQFIQHSIDAGLKQQKVNLAERLLMLPFMPMIKKLMNDAVATQRDIMIYQCFCDGQSEWNEARRKKEADNYAAEKMNSLYKSMGAATREVSGAASRPGK